MFTVYNLDIFSLNRISINLYYYVLHFIIVHQKMWLFSYVMCVELHFFVNVKKIVLDHLIHFICVKEFDMDIFMIIIIRQSLR